jgi:hypothetical protein
MIFAIVGGIAGVAGAVIGHFVLKPFGFARASALAPVILVVISVQLTSGALVPWLNKEFGSVGTIADLKSESRLFQVILHYHPEAEEEMRKRFREIASAPSNRQAFLSRSLGAEMATTFINQHSPMASDKAIHNLLKNEADTLSALMDDPEACVGIYLRMPSARVENVPTTLMAARLDAVADVVESAFTEPVPPPTNIEWDSIVEAIAAAYARNGFDPRELGLLDSLTTLAPDKGCQIATRFTTVLASMNPAEAVLVYKALIGGSQDGGLE